MMRIEEENAGATDIDDSTRSAAPLPSPMADAVNKLAAATQAELKAIREQWKAVQTGQAQGSWSRRLLERRLEEKPPREPSTPGSVLESEDVIARAKACGGELSPPLREFLWRPDDRPGAVPCAKRLGAPQRLARPDVIRAMRTPPAPLPLRRSSLPLQDRSQGNAAWPLRQTLPCRLHPAHAGLPRPETAPLVQLKHACAKPPDATFPRLSTHCRRHALTG